jgi:hypothetical protein
MPSIRTSGLLTALLRSIGSCLAGNRPIPAAELIADRGTRSQQAIANVAAKCMEALAVIAQRLDELGELRPGISPGRRTDMLWFYFGPNAWYSLVGDRGWTFDQAEQWLLDAARRDLVKEPAN